MIEISNEQIWVPSETDISKEVEFIRQQIQEIGTENIANTIDEAVKYRGNAYTPYSNYKVGAAILTTSGKIFGGCNSESVAYSPTNHAEGTALQKPTVKG
jgi:cytidine deaminase